MLHGLVWGAGLPTLLIGDECGIRILSMLFCSGGLLFFFILMLWIAILSTVPVCELLRYEIWMTPVNAGGSNSGFSSKAKI